MRQALDRLLQRVARQPRVGFGRLVALGEIFVGDGKLDLHALRAIVRAILQDQRGEIENCTRRQRPRQRVLGLDQPDRQQRQGEAGESQVGARLVQAAGRQRGAEQQAVVMTSRGSAGGSITRRAPPVP